MRIVRANNRAARRKRAYMVAIKDAVSKRTPFCYIEYFGLSVNDEEYRRLWYNYCEAISYGDYSAKPPMIENTTKNRVFLTYAKAIAHLTALKLNACEEDEEYQSLNPCKIVQGYYTVSGKEVIEQTQGVSDERNSVGRDDSSSRQLRQQRRTSISVPKTMGPGWATSGGSWATTGSSSITTVDFDWAVANTVPNYDGWRTTTSCV